jgi:hypothetical protein
MAKKLTSEAEGGDPKSIPNRNEEAVFLSHLNKLRQQASKAEAKKAEYDAEKAALTDLFRQAKADGFSRKELQAILDDSASSRRDLLSEEERRAKLRSWAGLPAGTQADLFAGPSAAFDELAAEGQGYTAGLRGDDSKMPDTYPAHYAPAFMRGWHAGQEKLAWALSEAGTNPERKDTGMQAQPIAPANDEGDDDQQEAA